MSPSQLRYVLVDNGLGAGVLNFVLNAGIAWAMFFRQPIVPLWGRTGVAADTIATSFILPFVTCVIVTRLTARHVRAGRIAPLDRQGEPLSILDRVPERTLPRAIVFAFASLVLLGSATVAVLMQLGVEGMPFRQFVLFKAGFAVADGALVPPLLAYLALARSKP